MPLLSPSAAACLPLWTSSLSLALIRVDKVHLVEQDPWVLSDESDRVGLIRVCVYSGLWERRRARAFMSLRPLNNLKSGLLATVALPHLVSSLPCGSEVKPSVSRFSAVHAVLVSGHVRRVIATFGIIV